MQARSLLLIALVACGKGNPEVPPTPPPEAPEPPMANVTKIRFEATALGGGSAAADALAHAATTLKARLNAANMKPTRVKTEAGALVVWVPDATPPMLDRVRQVAVTGDLQFKLVDDGAAYTKALFQHVGETSTGSATDPAALAAGITADVDRWKGSADDVHTDYYLRAPDRDGQLGRETIAKYVAAAGSADPALAVPADRELGYERLVPDDPTRDKVKWRSYLLVKQAELTGAAVTHASQNFDPNTTRPVVLVDFSPDGTKTLAALTTRIAGKKLAFVFDGTIRSAPVITGPIVAGRASIAMGGYDADRQERETHDISLALTTGSLGVALRETAVMPPTP